MQFYSLIRTFSSIDINIKDTAYTAAKEPGVTKVSCVLNLRWRTTLCYVMISACITVCAAFAAQAVVENAQHYVLERKSWIAKRMFPETVDLDVTTTLLVTESVR